MSPTRTVPPPYSGQYPVRFYKIVALSFLCLTLVLLGVILFMSSKRATITAVVTDDPVTVETDVTVGKTLSPVSVAGTVTSTLVVLEQTFSPTGNREEPGIATGKVLLHNETGASQPLVATTRLLTPEGVLFRLKTGVTVPAKGTVEVEVYADKEGGSGNIGPVDRFEIPGLGASLRPLIYGSSSVAMTGGVKTIGVLTDADVNKAKAELEAALLAAGKKKLEAAHNGLVAVYSISDMNIETNAEVGKEVSGFVVKGSGTAVAVLYEEKPLGDIAKSALQKRVIGNAEVVIPSDNPPSVTVKEMNLADGTATLTVSYSGFLSINPESKELDKAIFYGKNKEEVRRYLLSLDHVQSVEVVFRPFWVRSIPFVPDHVELKIQKR